MLTIDETLEKLSRSKFRSSFKFTKKERAYIEEKGMDVIRSHASDFVRNKLVPPKQPNDGKQTPMSGHPVFKAMHATACCCRECFEKWYKIPQNIPLTYEQEEWAVELIIEWVNRH